LSDSGAQSGRVLVVGSANVDVVLLVDDLPEPGATVLAHRTDDGFGGKGANQAVAAAAAGAPTTMVGRVGGDAAGAAYRERLAGFGIDVRHLLVTAGARTGTAYVMVDDDGENSIVVDPGANAEVGLADLDPVADLEPGDVLLVQGELPHRVVAEAIRRAHAAGARVVLNLAPYISLPADVVELADPLVVNEEEQRSRELAAPLFEKLGRTEGVPASLLVTRGARGAVWGDLELPATAVPEDEILDTTGAGDAFCGALAAALAAGSDRASALRAALAAGADAVRRLGAQPG
jgi:ribokinase